MSDTPSNPFANLTAPTAGPIGAPSAISGKNGGGPTGPSGGGDAQRAKINRFTPLEFTGTASQLFGIQMLNLFLIIITLGVWTPWARVRRRRFFFNNTTILGEGIDYTATGFTLFKGWAIVSLLLIAFYTLPFLGVPFAQEGLAVLLLPAYPWVINRSLRFNAQNTAWRDVRFNFKGSYLGSLWYLFLLPIIGVFSLGLLLPLASKAMREYIARNYAFGTASFSSNAGVAAYYGAGVKSVLLFILMSAALFAAIWGVLTGFTDINLTILIEHTGNDNQGNIADGAPISMSIATFVPFALVAMLLITTTYYRALTRNIMVGALRLDGGVKFRSTISGSILAWITISNIVLTIVTVGLLWPWAQVRRHRFMTESTEIRPINDLKGFIDKERAAGNAVGDAFGEAGNIDIQF
ncbi:YjgN family protein [Alphaproteobacteria bacterium]|nr:YjgN family protein [Alphaproteobacteria bacterium]